MYIPRSNPTKENKAEYVRLLTQDQSNKKKKDNKTKKKVES